MPTHCAVTVAEMYDTALTQSRHKKLVLRPRQERLLQLLADRKSMTPREIWGALGVSKQGALDLLRPLVEAGLVKRTGTRKSGNYTLV